MYKTFLNLNKRNIFHNKFFTVSLKDAYWHISNIKFVNLIYNIIRIPASV